MQFVVLDEVCLCELDRMSVGSRFSRIVLESFMCSIVISLMAIYMMEVQRCRIILSLEEDGTAEYHFFY